MSTCRFCGEWGFQDDLVKYGTRHYAHANCYLAKRGLEGLETLSLHQLETFPVLMLKPYTNDPIGHMEGILARRRAATAKSSDGAR